MDYKDFIIEQKILLKEAKTLFNAEDYDKNHSFRKWRFKLTESINRIKMEGFNIVCDIESRSFGDINVTAEKYQRDVFNMELQDTINEVKSIIDNFGKYGAPNKCDQESRDTKELDLPQIITLNWLFRHAPISLWLKLIGVLILAFSLGISIGQSKLFHEIKGKITQRSEIISTTGVPNNRL